jgi:hypothetical protein
MGTEFVLPMVDAFPGIRGSLIHLGVQTEWKESAAMDPEKFGAAAIKGVFYATKSVRILCN